MLYLAPLPRKRKNTPTFLKNVGADDTVSLCVYDCFGYRELCLTFRHVKERRVCCGCCHIPSVGNIIVIIRAQLVRQQLVLIVISGVVDEFIVLGYRLTRFRSCCHLRLVWFWFV